MKTINQLVEKLYKEAKHKMMTKQKDAAIYKELMKNLIVQVRNISHFLIKASRV